MNMKILAILLSVFFVLNINSHPVSYRDSIGLMGDHSPMLMHSQLNYSFRHSLAIGLHHMRRPNLEGAHGSFITANILVKRWNGDGFQANTYLNIGLGKSQLTKVSRDSAMGLFQFDIENRDYYFLAKHIGVFNENWSEFGQSVVRVGFSPYVVNFDGLHSWIILEWQKSSFKHENGVIDLTPFLRVFYKNLLFEIGQSIDGVTKFNYITHF